MTETLRADAQRNRLRILEAARVVFAEHGLDAPVTEIADRAGVGVGTIFRRFPTKEHLLAAVVEQRAATLIATADQALAQADPGAGLRRFMEAAASLYIGDRGWCDAADTDVFGREGLREQIDVLTARLAELVARAQDAGVVRADVRAADVLVLLTAVAKSGLRLEEAAPGAWRRYLGIVLDGLRPGCATPLRRPLTRKEFEAVISG